MMLYVALKLYFQQNTQTVYNFTGFLNDCQFNLYLFQFQDFNKGKMQNIEDSLESLVSRRRKNLVKETQMQKVDQDLVPV